MYTCRQKKQKGQGVCVGNTRHDREAQLRVVLHWLLGPSAPIGLRSCTKTRTECKRKVSVSWGGRLHMCVSSCSACMPGTILQVCLRLVKQGRAARVSVREQKHGTAARLCFGNPNKEKRVGFCVREQKPSKYRARKSFKGPKRSSQ